MATTTSAAEFLPGRLSLASLRKSSETCRGCDLYRGATQTVFGQGRRSARLVLLGEMPGNEEDLAGKPFVGPAGRLLNRAFAEAGVRREDIYLTNVVKHFRWTPRGNRRLHKKPTARHIEACRPWLNAEFLVVEPLLTICLGATAAQAILGRGFRVTKDRGKVVQTRDLGAVMATYHPSAILRAPTSDARDAKFEFLTRDLRSALTWMGPRRPMEIHGVNEGK